MHINFGGPLNNLQVKNHDLAIYVVSSWTDEQNWVNSGPVYMEVGNPR